MKWILKQRGMRLSRRNRNSRGIEKNYHFRWLARRIDWTIPSMQWAPKEPSIWKKHRLRRESSWCEKENLMRRRREWRLWINYRVCKSSNYRNWDRSRPNRRSRGAFLTKWRIRRWKRWTGWGLREHRKWPISLISRTSWRNSGNLKSTRNSKKQKMIKSWCKLQCKRRKLMPREETTISRTSRSSNRLLIIGRIIWRVRFLCSSEIEEGMMSRAIWTP